MATLDTTVGGTASNSYVSIAEADSYLDGRLYVSDWTAATTQEKTAALIMATRLLDEWVAWEGTSYASTQALQFPRLDVFDRHGVEFSSDVIPAFLKNATAELALWLLDEDRTKDPDTLGFSQISAGPVRVTVDKTDRRHVLPESVISIIKFYGKVRSTTPSTVRLMRV